MCSQGDEFYENGGGMGPPRRGRGGPPRRFFNRRSFRGGYRQMPRRPNPEYQVCVDGPLVRILTMTNFNTYCVLG